jgi:hypothetical protein
MIVVFTGCGDTISGVSLLNDAVGFAYGDSTSRGVGGHG